jgi:hypothetical protein
VQSYNNQRCLAKKNKSLSRPFPVRIWSVNGRLLQRFARVQGVSGKVRDSPQKHG